MRLIYRIWDEKKEEVWEGRRICNKNKESSWEGKSGTEKRLGGNKKVYRLKKKWGRRTLSRRLSALEHRRFKVPDARKKIRKINWKIC